MNRSPADHYHQRAAKHPAFSSVADVFIFGNGADGFMEEAEENKNRKKTQLRIYAYALIGILVAACCTIYERRTREPEYGGEPLRYWLQQLPMTAIDPSGRQQINITLVLRDRKAYGVTNKYRMDEATVAIRSTGTNALPFLVHQMSSYDSKWKVSLIQKLSRTKLSGQVEKFFPSKEFDRWQATTALNLLGENALPALSALERLTNHSDKGVAASANYVVKRLKNR